MNMSGLKSFIGRSSEEAPFVSQTEDKTSQEPKGPVTIKLLNRTDKDGNKLEDKNFSNFNNAKSVTITMEEATLPKNCDNKAVPVKTGGSIMSPEYGLVEVVCKQPTVNSVLSGEENNTSGIQLGNSADEEDENTIKEKNGNPIKGGNRTRRTRRTRRSRKTQKKNQKKQKKVRRSSKKR